jgi:hypothetical protein
MILNPRTKLIIREEESWEGTNVDEYCMASRRRFIEQYDGPHSETGSELEPEVQSPSTSRRNSTSRSNSNPQQDPSTSCRNSIPQQDQRLVHHSDPQKRTRKSIANDQAYQDSLVERSSKRRRNDFDRYIEIPNDYRIDDSLSW